MFIQKQMLSPSPMPGVIISGYELKLNLSVFSLSTFGICISKLLIKNDLSRSETFAKHWCFKRCFKHLISHSIFCFNIKSCYFQKQGVKSDYLFQRSIWHCLSIYHVYLHFLNFWSMNSCQSIAVRWSQHCRYPEWSQSSRKNTKLISS